MVKEAFKTKELSWSFIYFLLRGAIVPRYDDYMYFYITSEDGSNFSNFTYGMLKLASFFGSLLGVVVYTSCLKHSPIRSMIILANCIDFVSGAGTLMFLRRVYLGMEPVIFYGFVQLISDAFSMSFHAMPAMALVAKLIPHSIESAMFAFYTGLITLTYFFLAKISGNLVNLYF